MSEIVEGIRKAIRVQRAIGLAPIEMHMTAQTYAHFSLDAGEEIEIAKTPDRRSYIEKMMGTGEEPVTRRTFERVAIVKNPEMPEGAIFLRPQQLMDDPQWLKRVMHSRQDAQPALPTEGTPWQKLESVDVPKDHEEASLELLNRVGGISPTTVIMKSMEDIERVKDVVVLRFRHNGDIEMSSTFDRYGIAGGLQAALGYIMGGGGR